MLGEVPEGWEENTLGDLTTVAGGTTPKREVAEYWADGSVCWATPTDITSLPLSSYELTITREKISNLAVSKGGSKVFPPRTVLMTSRATIGYVAIANIPTSTNQGFANFLPNSSYEPQFLCYLLEAKRDEIVQKSGGSTFKEISKSSLKSISILLPPLPEQQRIAEILSSVDESIRATEAVIAQAERVKRGLMEDLLTGGLGSAAIANGDVPEGWEVKELGHFAEVKGGKRMPKGAAFSDDVTPYPYIRVSDFKNGTISTDDIKYVSKEHQTQIARYTISKEDIYISIAGTLGVVGMVPDQLDGAQLTENAAKIIITSKHQACKEYVTLVLQSELGQSQIHVQKGVGGGVPKLALFRIAEIKIPLPPLPEQQRIAEILSSMDTQITTNRATVEQFQRLKRGLMDDLLTGKVRTVA